MSAYSHELVSVWLSWSQYASALMCGSGYAMELRYELAFASESGSPSTEAPVPYSAERMVCG